MILAFIMKMIPAIRHNCHQLPLEQSPSGHLTKSRWCIFQCNPYSKSDCVIIVNIWQVISCLNKSRDTLYKAFMGSQSYTCKYIVITWKMITQSVHNFAHTVISLCCVFEKIIPEIGSFYTEIPTGQPTHRNYYECQYHQDYIYANM